MTVGTSGTEDIVDWAAFARTRAQLAGDFVRILGYFREDGEKAITAIEDAMRRTNAAALVVPAHALKDDAAQMGATLLEALAETIELVARRCVEAHDAPSELIADVVRLRPLFRETMTLLEREASPPAAKRVATAFGRRAGALR